MSKYSSKSQDEVPSRKSDASQRRSAPADSGPYSPSKIAAIYAKGKEGPGKNWAPDEHLPQDETEKRAKDYLNDVPLKGERAWLRGGGEGHRPNMDEGKLDPSNVPPKATGPRNTASGRDITASPFSAASHDRRDENDWVPNSKLNPRK
jgi:hypothetical protein